MKAKHLVISLVLALILASGSTALAGEHYFKFKITHKQELERLTHVVSISSVEGNIVYAYANDGQLKALKDLGYTIDELSPPSTLGDPGMAIDLEDMADWDNYPSYDQYETMMYQFETDYPNLCQIHDIGSTPEGHRLLFARISDNVGTAENEPEVVYSSSMHGDETTGYVLMLRLIDSLLSTYGTDPGVTDMVNSMEIWINPLANPDGTYAGGDASVYGATRFNSNYVDINRNFPDPAFGDHPDGNDWQPETIAMMNFAEGRNIVLSANFHGGIEVVNYPWDCWVRLHPDDVWYYTISRAYADSAQHYSPTGYMDDLDDGITNGFQWYPVHGGRQDYMNYWHGCREVTIELSATKLVSASTLPNYWIYNRVSLFEYLRRALFGVRGVVTDAQTGLPVAATVSIADHDADSSWVYCDVETGNYHRMIEPGTFDITFSADGYLPFTAFNVVVTDGNITVVDISLEPEQIVLDCGDANADEAVNPADALYLVNYFYHGGPAPAVPAACDVDGSGDMDPLDLVYLVNYFYRAGLEPDCNF